MDLLELNKANQGGPGGQALLTLISEKKIIIRDICIYVFHCGVVVGVRVHGILVHSLWCVDTETC